MRLAVFFAFLVIMAISGTAHASAVMVCNVKADILSSIKNGDVYNTRIRVIESNVGNNTSDKSACFTPDEKEMDISINKKFEANTVQWLRFVEYSGLGPDGPVSSKSWEVPAN